MTIIIGVFLFLVVLLYAFLVAASAVAARTDRLMERQWRDR